MPERNLPVRPHLGQLKRQAKELLRAAQRGEAEALAEFTQFHPEPIDPATAQLADAQLVLARAYGGASWPRLVQSCDLIAAIWRNDIKAVRELLSRHPELIHEDARVRRSNWGPPMSYAANLGRDRIVKLLHEMGAGDHQRAIGRALLQSKIDTARLLHDLMGRPAPPPDALEGPAYTLSASGTQLALELGAKVFSEDGRRIAPVGVVLETDSRNPKAKHAILEMYAKRGVELPDTPVMALHRGRIDILERHLRSDPGLLTRQFSHEEIYPPELDCSDEILATHGTPLKGATLLHMCCDYDELDIAKWLIGKGADVNARAAIDRDGFGGHTALFATVVSQPNHGMNYGGDRPQAAPFTELLLDHGADPNVRVSLRKELHPGYGDPGMHEYRNVTPLSWGRRFHNKLFVSTPAMELIEQAGGVE